MPRFAHLPTTSQADTTRNFEQLEGFLKAFEERSAEGRQKASTGEWTKVTLSPKLEEIASLQTLRVRTEGSRVFLRGGLVGKAAEEVAAGGVILTLPVGFRPTTKTVSIDALIGVTATFINILTSGVLEAPGVAVNSGTGLRLDGKSFNLT